MEIQFFHYNKKSFNSFDEALQSTNGVVALGIFVFAEENHNEKWSSFIEDVQQVQKPGLILSARPFPMSDLMTAFNSYWYYHGSLTTPPCSNTVSWIISNEPVKLSIAQVRFQENDCFQSFKYFSFKIEAFHGLVDHSGSPILSNIRPLQKLNSRRILKVQA